jgi:indolepyruvate ferredoxin oxidoreductase beta subunit
VAYATQYLNRLLSVRDAEAKFGDGTSRVLLEAARYTALWMTYEDTIRVADLKIRRTRFNRVGDEAQVQNDQILQIREFLHPRSEEFADTLPTAVGRWLLRTKPVTNIIEKLTKNGIILQTTSIHGYIMLYFIARLKPIRRRSLRFNLEQERMDQWIISMNREIESNYALAHEIAECANLIKGYGDTHANGWRNFLLVMEQVQSLRNESGVAGRISELRKAALADEDGTKLRAILA